MCELISIYIFPQVLKTIISGYFWDKKVFSRRYIIQSSLLLKFEAITPLSRFTDLTKLAHDTFYAPGNQARV